MLYTGEVRKIEADAIRRRLDDDELVLISPLGYSPTGEIFNLTLEDVAAECAVALQADKLIFLTEQTGVTDRKGNLLRELTVSGAQAILKQGRKTNPFAMEYLPLCVKACMGGVGRVHLVDRKLDGGLLLRVGGERPRHPLRKGGPRIRHR